MRVYYCVCALFLSTSGCCLGFIEPSLLVLHVQIPLVAAVLLLRE